MEPIEQSSIRGEIVIHHYAFDPVADRTFVNVSAHARWLKPPLFQMTDYMTIVVQGADTSFAMLNNSSMACYRRSDGTLWQVFDIFEDTYRSFDEVRFRIPVRLVCRKGQPGILESVHVIYHGEAVGKAALIEVTSCYHHQAFRPVMNASIIGALTGQKQPLYEVLPTLTLTGEFPTTSIWCKVKRAELFNGSFDSRVLDISRTGESESRGSNVIFSDAITLIR